MEQLYKEIVNGKVVSIEEHKLAIHSSDLKKATKKEIKEAEDYFNKYGKCFNHHLIYDKAGSIYNSRYCGICKEFIGFI